MDPNLVNVFDNSQTTGLDDAGVLAWLNTSVVYATDNQVYHWDGVMQALANGAPGNGLTAQEIATAVDILAQMPVGFQTLHALFTTGCQISSPQFQATVQAMEASEPPGAVAILNAVLAIGLPKSKPQWQLLGIAQQPVLADVTAARAQFALNEKVQAFQQTVWNPLVSSGTATAQQLKDAVNNYAWS